jgi:hypothetical protein
VTSSASQPTPTLTVVPGDTMTVRGSDIDCGVPTAAPLAVVWGIVSHRALAEQLRDQVGAGDGRDSPRDGGPPSPVPR